MRNIFINCILSLFIVPLAAGNTFETDTVKTSAGDLVITCVGHATLMLKFNKLIIHVDPVGWEADYTQMPDADIILVTHEHEDHFDLKAISLIKTAKTVIIGTAVCSKNGLDCHIMANKDTFTKFGIKIKAIAAYNIKHKRKNGQLFHPPGRGNGYILTLGDKTLYIAADTENTPEMESLTNIDIAFLPMNIPFTMTPEMVAHAAKAFKPGILYPYHLGKTDTQRLVDLLDSEKDIDLRIRNF